MKHIVTLMLALSLAIIITGCRQKDIRSTIVCVPQATTAKVQSEILDALKQIDGIDVAGASFTNGLLYLHYDSMKLGIRNIEHAIKDIGYDANDFKGEKR